MRSFALALALCAGVAGGLAAVQGAPLVDQPYRVSHGDRFATDVVINGQGPFDVLIDTGSSRTILYEHARAKLGLQAGAGTIVIFGIAGRAQSPPYSISQMQLGKETLKDLTIAVLPDPHDEKVVPDGILGIDVLARYLMVLDRGALRLRLYAPTHEIPTAIQTWPHVPLRPHAISRTSSKFWVFDASFGHNKGEALLDLGAGATILNWPMAYRFGFHEINFPKNPPEQVRDALGTSAPSFLLQDLLVQIGERSWTRQDAIVAQARVFDLVELAKAPAAIIGPGLFKNTSLAIDFAGRRLYLAPPGSERQPLSESSTPERAR